MTEANSDQVTAIMERLMVEMNLLITAVIAGTDKTRFARAAKIASIADSLQRQVGKRVGDFRGNRNYNAILCGDDDILGENEDEGGIYGAVVNGVQRQLNGGLNEPPQVAMLRQAMDVAKPFIEMARHKTENDLRASKIRQLNELIELDKTLKEAGIPALESNDAIVASLKKEIEDGLVHSKLLRGREADGGGGEEDEDRLGKPEHPGGSGDAEGGYLVGEEGVAV